MLSKNWRQQETGGSFVFQYFSPFFFYFLTQGRRKSNLRPPFLESVSDSQYHRPNQTFCFCFFLRFFMSVLFTGPPLISTSQPQFVSNTIQSLRKCFFFSVFFIDLAFCCSYTQGGKKTYIYCVIGDNCQTVFFSSASLSACILVPFFTW